MEPLTRKELAAELREMGLTTVHAEKATEHVIMKIADALRNGRRIEFRGSFIVKSITRKAPLVLGSKLTKDVTTHKIKVCKE